MNDDQVYVVLHVQQIFYENEYDYFICELPLSESMKGYIAEKYPDLDCKSS